MPHWKTSLHPWINILSMKDKWAVVPGDGTASATFITTQDLGRFIGRLMDAPEWDKESTVVGNEMQFNNLVALAEEIRGEILKANMRHQTPVLTQRPGCKFEVAYDSLEKLRAGKISFADRFPQIGMGTAADDEAFFALVHYLAGSGNFVVAPGRRTLNDQFPEIQLTTCEEVMQTAWQGRT